jgi:adenine phosphoribosyltransferase
MVMTHPDSVAAPSPSLAWDPGERLRRLIRDVPDFPRPGIMFRDFTPLLADPAGLALAVELMANPFRGRGVELVLGAESRGFIFGTAIAQSLSAGFVPIRKKGKLPHTVDGVDYELEYGRDRLEIHSDALRSGQRVLLVDDLVATGGTLEACGTLIERAGGSLVGISVLIELSGLDGRSMLERFGELRSVIRY